MKKRNVFVLSMVLCAVLVFVTISHVYAQQEETQLGETQNITEPSPVPEMEQPVQTDPENTEPVNEPEQPEPTETPESPEASEAPESSVEPEPTPLPLPSDTAESSDDPEEEPTDIPDIEESPVPEEIKSNPAVAAEIEFALKRLGTHIDYIASLIGASDNYTLVAGDDNFYEALAIYAIRHDQIENYPYGVVISDEKESAEFQSIFWSLNAVSASRTENSAIVRISRLSAVGVYALSGAEIDTFDMLNSNDNRELVRMLLSD